MEGSENETLSHAIKENVYYNYGSRSLCTVDRKICKTWTLCKVLILKIKIIMQNCPIHPTDRLPFWQTFLYFFALNVFFLKCCQYTIFLSKIFNMLKRYVNVINEFEVLILNKKYILQFTHLWNQYYKIIMVLLAVVYKSELDLKIF